MSVYPIKSMCLCVTPLPGSVDEPHSESLVTMETEFGERPNTDASIPRLQSEAVASDLQELSLQPTPNLMPVTERKNGEFLLMHRHDCVNVSIKWFVRGTQRN